MKLSRKKLELINELVRIPKIPKNLAISKYKIQIKKEDKSIRIIAIDKNKEYIVYVYALDSNIEEDIDFTISDSEDFGSIISDLVREDIVELIIEKNKLRIKDKYNNSGIPLTKDDNDKEADITNDKRKRLLTSDKYGDKDVKLTIYAKAEGKEGAENKEDAGCFVDMSELKLDKIISIFSPETFEISINSNTLFFKTINTARSKDNVSEIKKEDPKDKIDIYGNSEVYIKSGKILSYLASKGGFISMYMKKELPIVINKKFEDMDIGVTYVIFPYKKSVKSEESTVNKK